MMGGSGLTKCTNLFGFCLQDRYKGYAGRAEGMLVCFGEYRGCWVHWSLSTTQASYRWALGRKGLSFSEALESFKRLPRFSSHCMYC